MVSLFKKKRSDKVFCNKCTGLVRLEGEIHALQRAHAYLRRDINTIIRQAVREALEELAYVNVKANMNVPKRGFSRYSGKYTHCQKCGEWLAGYSVCSECGSESCSA